MYIVSNPIVAARCLNSPDCESSKGNVSTHSVTAYISRANYQCCIPPVGAPYRYHLLPIHFYAILHNGP